ncbi:uncharacterized protein L201_001683 [Kwoniella dendrophila CBS 6074]|uniref:AAA+ ATPase domain-containing protein n=1 Tax=Kwoniella dendrophila CBS 6074 TaxID=1295534 RepID=A0AAX4JN63_9TREE
MAGATKRSRQDDNDTPTTPSSSSSSSSTTGDVTPTPTPAPTPPITRNNSLHHTRRQSTITTTTNTPSSSTNSNTTHRPPLTRSSATQQPSTRNNGLSRSNSLFNMTTRRSGLHATSSLSSIPSSSTSTSSSSSASFAIPSGSGSSSRVGMLTRTQSTPSITSPTQLKAAAMASSGGNGGQSGKGGPDNSGLGGNNGGRRFGKGKENIPPKKTENNENASNGNSNNDDGSEEGGSSRKRPRVSSRNSMSGRSTGRGRSGSVVSVRSETSGRHSSLAPSSSASSICSWSARLPSPAPSQASITPSIDSVTSADPLDLIKDDEEFDIGRTPTKARPVTRSTVLPPTPPPSSPSLRDVEIKSTTERVNLMRVHSDKTEVDIDMNDGEEKERKLNPYKQLKAFLRLSSSTAIDGSASVDQVIIGREEEKQALRSYLANRNDLDVGMYVSGPPGTGKTALVTALGRELAEEGWKVVELGCMGLKLNDVWRRLGEEFECGKTEKDVKEHITQDGAKILIILDEIDSLMPPPPSIAPPATSHLLTKLFSLPTNAPTVKLVSISNTLDLTLRARLVLPDSAQPSILPFKAYGAIEMAPIVSARISAANVEGIKIDSTAITLLAKKVEAQNGDLRMCLGVLSSAVNLAEAEWIKKTNASSVNEPGKTIPMTKIAVTHILKALTSYINQLKAAAGSGSSNGSANATTTKIKSVQLQGKMVLVSILVYVSRVRLGLNGCPSIGSGQITPPTTPSSKSSSSNSSSYFSSSSSSATTNNENSLNAQNLYATYSYLLLHNSSPFPPSPESDYRDLLSNLETLGLISLSTSTPINGMTRSSSFTSLSNKNNVGGGKIELNVREEEIKQALGLISSTTNSSNGLGQAEEEVKRIWERENNKLKRIQEKAIAARNQLNLADGTNQLY